ncbi:MAG: amidohydrolase [Firmicutes bacterium]|nr:amidohydrolase [Bacillota bacterium]
MDAAQKTENRSKAGGTGYLFTDGIVVTSAPDGPVWAPGDVAVRNGRIIYAGAALTPARREKYFREGLQHWPLGGRVIMPGLINTHTHAAMSLLRGYAEDRPLLEWLERLVFPFESRLSGEAVYWGTLVSCMEMIRGGITTLNDMYFFMEDAAKAVADSGMRAVLGWGLSGIDAQSAERALAQAEEFYQKWNGAAGGRIRVCMAPHATYTCPPAFLAQVVERAAALGAGLHIHVAESPEECRRHQEQFGETEVATLERLGAWELPAVAAHCVQVTSGDIRILARHGVAVSHNPTSNLKLGNGIAPVQEMLDAGITVALGTDGPASNNNQDLFQEMRLAAIAQKGRTHDPTVLPAPQVVAMATQWGAKALRWPEIGALKVGNWADLVILRKPMSHRWPAWDVWSDLVYACHGGDVQDVLVAGQVILKNGQFTALDEGWVLAAAQMVLEAVKPPQRNVAWPLPKRE